MSVNIIFRIAAVGILVTILVQVLKHSGRDEQAFLTAEQRDILSDIADSIFDHTCRTDPCPWLGDPVYL